MVDKTNPELKPTEDEIAGILVSNEQVPRRQPGGGLIPVLVRQFLLSGQKEKLSDDTRVANVVPRKDGDDRSYPELHAGTVGVSGLSSLPEMVDDLKRQGRRFLGLFKPGPKGP